MSVHSKRVLLFSIRKKQTNKQQQQQQTTTNLVVHDSVVVVDLWEERQRAVEGHVVVAATFQHPEDHPVQEVAGPLAVHLQEEVGPRVRPCRGWQMVELLMVVVDEWMVVRPWVVPSCLSLLVDSPMEEHLWWCYSWEVVHPMVVIDVVVGFQQRVLLRAVVLPVVDVSTWRVVGQWRVVDHVCSQVLYQSDCLVEVRQTAVH